PLRAGRALRRERRDAQRHGGNPRPQEVPTQNRVIRALVFDVDVARTPRHPGLAESAESRAATLPESLGSACAGRRAPVMAARFCPVFTGLRAPHREKTEQYVALDVREMCRSNGTAHVLRRPWSESGR